MRIASVCVWDISQWYELKMTVSSLWGFQGGQASEEGERVKSLLSLIPTSSHCPDMLVLPHWICAVPSHTQQRDTLIFFRLCPDLRPSPSPPFSSKMHHYVRVLNSTSAVCVHVCVLLCNGASNLSLIYWYLPEYLQLCRQTVNIWKLMRAQT